MKRTIKIEIETDDTGRYCERTCPALTMNPASIHSPFVFKCILFNEEIKTIYWVKEFGEERCAACLSAEKEIFKIRDEILDELPKKHPLNVKQYDQAIDDCINAVYRAFSEDRMLDKQETERTVSRD